SSAPGPTSCVCWGRAGRRRCGATTLRPTGRGSTEPAGWGARTRRAPAPDRRGRRTRPDVGSAAAQAPSHDPDQAPALLQGASRRGLRGRGAHGGTALCGHGASTVLRTGLLLLLGAEP